MRLKHVLNIVIILIMARVACGCTSMGSGGDPVKNMRSVERQAITRQIPAKGVRAIRVSEKYGTVSLEFNDEDTITVSATRVIKGKTEREARRRLIDMRVITRRKGAALIISASYPEGFYGKYRGRVNFAITAPRGVAADVNADHGIVTIAPGAGGVKARTRSGNVNVFEPGGAVSVSTLSGDIRLESAVAPGADVFLSSASGDVNVMVPKNTRAIVSAKFSRGNGAVSLPLAGSEQTPTSIHGILNARGISMTVKSQSGHVLLSPYVEKK